MANWLGATLRLTIWLSWTWLALASVPLEPTLAWAQPPEIDSLEATAEDRQAFDQALEEANSNLDQAQGRGGCPGLNLVVTCGDGACDAKKGETASTCPADCVPALIKSYNSQTLCRGITRVYKPSSPEEIQGIVRAAQIAGEKIRVVGALHSANEQLCTVGSIISTERLNRILAIETFQGRETVVAEAGVKLYDLAEWLHARGRSLGFVVIGFRGVTVAGSAATGSHGSSPHHSAVVSSAIEAVSVVTADGELREYSALNTDDATWRALRANLGMLGVVTRVRFRVEPQFNLHVKVSYEKEDVLFEKDGVLDQVRDCDFALINWFPGTGRYMRSCGKKTREPADPGASNTLLDPRVPNFFVRPFKKVLQFGACYNPVACAIERARYWLFKIAPPYVRNDRFGDPVPSDDVIGPSHRMLSSDLTPHQRGLFQMDWEIAVPYSRLRPAMAAVRAHAKRNKICLPLVGVFLRFAPAEDSTLLAHTVAQGAFKAGEPVVFIEMPVYLPTAFSPGQKAAYDRVYEEFARLLITQFDGRPHWGKNRDWVFPLTRELDAYGPNLKLFAQVVRQMDPLGTFMNDWGKLLGLAATPAR